MIEEGRDERSDGGGDVERVVLPGQNADVVGEERVDVGGGGGDQRSQNEEEHQGEERLVLRHRVQTALAAENQLAALDDGVQKRLEMSEMIHSNVLRDHTVLDLQSHDRGDEVGKPGHEEKALVGNHRRAVFMNLLPITADQQGRTSISRRERIVATTVPAVLEAMARLWP